MGLRKIDYRGTVKDAWDNVNANFEDLFNTNVIERTSQLENDSNFITELPTAFDISAVNNLALELQNIKSSIADNSSAHQINVAEVNKLLNDIQILIAGINSVLLSQNNALSGIQSRISELEKSSNV